jgi:hypothetical protein
MARGRIVQTPSNAVEGSTTKKKRVHSKSPLARPGNQNATKHGMKTSLARALVGSMRKLKAEAIAIPIMDANAAADSLSKMLVDIDSRITALENVYAHFESESGVGITILYTLVQRLLNTRMLVTAKLADLAANKELHEREVARARELSDEQAEQQVLEYMLSTDVGRKRVLKMVKDSERMAKLMERGPKVEPLESD